MNSLKLAAILVCSTIFVACQSAPTNVSNTTANLDSRSQSTPQPAPTADVIAEAKEIFATNCMICHKENGTGGPVTIDGKKLNPDNLTADKMKMMTDDKLIGYVTNGVVDEGMPAFKDKLTEEEIKLVVAHIRRLQGP
jgi:mono/diheme cytochrome c family protein